MTAQFPRMLAGRYEVRDLIGRGGMAEVHLGYDTRLSRTIAIKLLRSDMAEDATFQARFRREAQSAAALNHPSIVAVYDSGEEQVTGPDGRTRGVPYIVMEYVEGHTVRELLGEGEAVPIDEAVEIVTGVLDALEYSHRAGIVHRDIKPGNIMLTSTGAVKVMDFGIARAIEDSAATVTQTHAVVGTAQYLSPEQARGELVDSRSDLYSTGCLLYELLTGRPPFQGDSAVAIAYQHVREIPKAPSATAPDVPESLDRVVLKALAKNREDRYQDAAHMRTDLLAAARGLAVSAPSTDTWTAATTVLATAPGAASGTAAAATSSTSSPAPPAPPEDGQGDKAQVSSKRSRGWVWAFIIAFLLLLAVVIGLVASGRIGGGTAPTIATASATAAAVPDLTGMTESEAKKALEAVGLEYSRGDDVASDTVAQGIFVSSDPGAGTKAVYGTTVTVHFSSGSAMVSVPDVTGKTQAEARTAIEGAGLTVGNVTSEDAAGVDSGDVVRTDPVSGTSVQRKSSVSIVVASGNVAVPDVNGMTQAEATSALQGSDLSVVVSDQRQTTTDQSKDGTVASTNPGAGSVVASGTSVTVTLYSYVAPASEAPSPSSGSSAPAAAGGDQH